MLTVSEYLKGVSVGMAAESELFVSGRRCPSQTVEWARSGPKVFRKRITMRGPMRGSSVDYEAVAKDIPGQAIEAIPRETVRRISRRCTKRVSRTEACCGSHGE